MSGTVPDNLNSSRYDPQADALYVRTTLEALTVVETHEVADGVLLDLDASRRVIGLEVLDVSRRAGVPPECFAPPEARAVTVPSDNPLPEFFRRLGNAQEAAEEVDSFDLDSGNPLSRAAWEELLLKQNESAAALVAHVLQHGPAILRLLEGRP